jgi:hypothetical protein
LQKGLLYGALVFVVPSTGNQNSRGKSDRIRLFKKLAQLVEKTEKARESQHP